MATCGRCKQEGQTVEHVRQCYATGAAQLTEERPVEGFAKAYVESKDFKPMATAPKELPDSRYAVADSDDTDDVRFFQVDTGKDGTRWEGFRFVSELFGAPGDWRRVPVKGARRKAVLELLSSDPERYALAYSRFHTRCAVCESPLSDPESRARGFGPICAKRFG